MKTYVEWFSAENMDELTKQINYEAKARDLNIVNISLSQDSHDWFYALVVFGKEGEMN